MSGLRIFRDEAFVARPAAEVFSVYLDVETWPVWTSTVTQVLRLDAGPRLGPFDPDLGEVQRIVEAGP